MVGRDVLMGEVGVVILGVGGGVGVVAGVGRQTGWIVLDLMVVERVLIMAVVLELFTGISRELVVGESV